MTGPPSGGSAVVVRHHGTIAGCMVDAVVPRQSLSPWGGGGSSQGHPAGQQHPPGAQSMGAAQTSMARRVSLFYLIVAVIAVVALLVLLVVLHR